MLALVAGGVLAVCAIGAAIVLLTRGEEEKAASPPRATVTPARLERVQGLAARVRSGRRIALRTRPDGRVLATVGARTGFGSPQTLAVAYRKGDWLAVRSPALRNEEVGWVRDEPLRLIRRPLQLEVDLSRRELSVVIPRGDVVHLKSELSVAVGAPDTPTPTGEFYVTDKLRGTDFGPYYGCCILALSGRQPRLPRGWSGGDRLAIHGSPTPTWGYAVSNGCLHASEQDLRFLMRIVPLGTVVRVHA